MAKGHVCHVAEYLNRTTRAKFQKGYRMQVTTDLWCVISLLYDSEKKSAQVTSKASHVNWCSGKYKGYTENTQLRGRVICFHWNWNFFRESWAHVKHRKKWKLTSPNFLEINSYSMYLLIEMFSVQFFVHLWAKFANKRNVMFLFSDKRSWHGR